MDIKVGRGIFDNCVRGFLGDKIVVLVTHQIQYAKEADKSVVMKEGSICCQGTYDEIIKDPFVEEFFSDLKRISDRRLYKSPYIDMREVHNSHSSERTTAATDSNEPLSKFLTEEDSKPAANSIMTYLHYFWTGGLFSTCLMLLLSLLGYSSLFLSYWWMQSMSTCTTLFLTNQSLLTNSTNRNASMLCPWYMSTDSPIALVLLTLFTFFGSITTVLLGFTFYYTLLQASRRLHNRMLDRIMYSPMYFFDTNPSGRVLNRFSTDVGFLDELLPEFFYNLWVYANTIVFSILSSLIVQYYLIIPIVIKSLFLENFHTD